MNLFDKVNSWIENTETSIVNFVSAFSPWLAPLIPAFLTFRHTQTFLDFPLFMAVVSACVIEFLGLATISTTLEFWKHNQRYKTDKYQSPIWVSLFTFAFYLTIVLVVNVVLSADYYEPRKLIAVTLLTTLSIPAAVTIAVRTQHSETKREIKSRYSKKGETRPKKKAESFPKDFRYLSQSQKDQVKSMNLQEIMSLGVQERTARNWMKYVNNGHEKVMIKE
jgi:archaellum biogenesis protein FlaJ (TadC family)